MAVAGIDIGSLTTETVILSDEKKILGYSIILTGGDSRGATKLSMETATRFANLNREDIEYVISTGTGREIPDFANENVTEITCTAKGVNFLFPDVRTIIDIGGQDTKIIKVDGKGTVTEFDMNDKCAAGTGRFLEVMAKALGVELDKMGEKALQSKEDIQITSICTVFGESEVVSLVSEGKAVEDILNGVHNSIADRTIGLLERTGLVEKVAFTGGVAKNIGVVKALENKLNTHLSVYYEPQIVCALGAAIIALERKNKKKS
ncbi:MAG: 2-hydroxyglutaryl-CoA dehydratase [Spirochaetes bacterium]|nr:2-hydroxyglutaryl-CoA dehydratase [Deltaproteobacteria bacterium]RKY01323.1 MAG: 2-hydroxyglutaryl-CoA dehydratase [Spirochaetota bacterium]RLA91454.1 MAG: 2-hydroxyglutaryl-CoA dehydratase [Deltaproteobacteria bacterium]